MTVEEAFARKISNIPLTAAGKVSEILADDKEGIPHQRFIIMLEDGQTVLVTHNLERAYRVPVKIGDKVEVHGNYVWNRHGGLIHETHHDDRGKHEDGWIIFVGGKNQDLPIRHLKTRTRGTS